MNLKYKIGSFVAGIFGESEGYKNLIYKGLMSYKYKLEAMLIDEDIKYDEKRSLIIADVEYMKESILQERNHVTESFKRSYVEKAKKLPEKLERLEEVRKEMYELYARKIANVEEQMSSISESNKIRRNFKEI